MSAVTNKLLEPFREVLASNWEQALNRDEWFFVRHREKMTDELSPLEAFRTIDDLVDLLLQQVDPTLAYYCGALLVSLARHSGTTECPSALRNDWIRIERCLEIYPDIIGQLREWYRRPINRSTGAEHDLGLKGLQP